MADALHGIVTALITPLNKDGTLDIASLERLIERQVEGGVNGLFVAGLTGEGAVLPEETLLPLVRRSARFVHGRIPLVAGALASSTEHTLRLAKQLMDEGADFLSTTAPLAFCPSQAAIMRHFEILTRETGARWMVYGNAFSYPEILPDTFQRLSEIDGIVAFKDTRPDYQGALRNLIAVEDKGVAYLSGGEYLIGAMFLMGANGNISGLSSLFPAPFVRLYAATKAKDVEKVAVLSREIAELHTELSALGFWLAAFKATGARMGIMQSWCAEPCAPLTTPEALNRIDQLIERYQPQR